MKKNKTIEEAYRSIYENADFEAFKGYIDVRKKDDAIAKDLAYEIGYDV